MQMNEVMKLFRKLIGLILAIQIIFQLGGAVLAAETEEGFSEDFENGLGNWNISSALTGETVKQDDNFVFKLNGKGKNVTAVAGNSYWNNYITEIDFRVSEGEYGGVLFYYQNEDNHYELRYYKKAQKFVLLKKINGSRYTNIAEKKFSIPSGESRRIRIEVLGQQITVSVSGEILIQTQAQGISGGMIGIRALDSVCYADNVRVDFVIEEGSINYGKYGMVPSAENMGMPKSYGALSGNSILELFEEMKAEIPEEFPVVAPRKPGGETKIFVSTDGNDSGTGSIDDPVATLEKGLELLRMADKRKGAVLYLRGGNYSVDKPHILDTAFSGTEEYPVYISNYQDEKVTLISGKAIQASEFEELTAEEAARVSVAARNNVRKINLESIGVEVPQDLTINPEAVFSFFSGETKLVAARYPNNTTVGMGNVIDKGPVTRGGGAGVDDGRGFEFEMIDDRPLNWKNTDDIWMHGAFYEEWEVGDYRIRTINKDTQSIRTYDHCRYGAEYKKNNNHYYYNILEELDTPGEYVIDRINGILYYYLMSSNPETELVSVATKKDTFFTCENSNYVYFSGIDFKNGSASAIIVNGGKGNTVQQCSFENFTDAALVFNGGKYNGMTCCIVNNCGDGYSSVSFKQPAAERYALTPMANYIQNSCIFNDVSSQNLISIMSACGVVVSHNLLCGAGNNGVTIGWANEIVVENNVICNTCLNIYDAAAIYECGQLANQGIHVRSNYIHDLCKYGDSLNTNSIYLDDFSSQRFVYDNVCQDGNLYIHGGQENVLANNLTTKSLIINDNYYKGQQDLWTTNFVGYKSQTEHLKSGVYQNNKVLWNSRYICRNVWDEKFLQLMQEYENPNYVRGELEDELRAPAGNVIMNNFAQNENIVDLAKATMVGYETNVFGEIDNSISFGENGIEDKDGILEKNSNFKILDITKTGPSSVEGIINRPVMTEPACIAPVNGQSGQVVFSDVVLKWTNSMGAYYYDVVVADDPEMKNVIEQATTTYNSLQLKNLEGYGKTYYWQVTAHSVADFVANKEAVSQIYSFTTMTEDEAIAYIPIQTKGFEITAEQLLEFVNGITEGNAPGEYKEGTIKAAKNAVAESKKIVSEAKLQTEVDEQRETLNQYMNHVYASVNEYVLDLPEAAKKNEFLFGDEWQIKDNGSSVVITPNSDGTGIDLLKEPVPRKFRTTFKMTMDDFSQWVAFFLRQSSTESPWSYASDNYVIVLKPDVLELQKYKAGKNYGIILEVENNSEIIESGVEYEYEFIIENTDEGVHIQMRVDGESVIDYIDRENTIETEGFFGMFLNKENGPVTFRNAKE